MRQFLAYTFIAIMLTMTACNDGSVIGNDLLENEAVELAYDDNFQLQGRTTLGDSIVTYRNGTTNQTHLLGRINDPVFGEYASSLYLNMAYGTSLPTFDNATIDSVVLELAYDTLGFYGDENVRHNLEVFRVTEDYADIDTIYSDKVLSTEMVALGSKSFVPDVMGDSIRFQVRVTDVDSFITLSPRINIRLDDAFGQEILDNTEAIIEDASLLESFKGLFIRSIPDGNSIIGLDFVKSGSVNLLIPKLAIYYTENGEKRSYNYLLRNEIFSNYEMNTGSSTVGNALNSFEAGEEFIYSQAMAGVNGEVYLPDLSALKGNIINSAQLVLTVSDADNSSYPTTQQFLLSTDNETGDGRILIEDILKGGTNLATGLQILDGKPNQTTTDTGETVTTVTFNITDYVGNVIEAETTTPKLTISPVGRAESPRRTIFFGASHPTYPAKLKIAYTII